ncbi:MAG: transglutaminase domain-containing protein [Anaerolineae bacterium]|nr:transglutaminase domain-containing protein [Anaerolineae bacterium]
MERLIRSLTYPKTLMWIFMLGLSFTVMGGIGTIVRGLNYQLLAIVSLGGLLLGWLLARIRAPWWLALLIVIGSGLQVVVIVVGYLLPFIWAIVRVVLVYALILGWWGPDGLPGIDPLVTAWQNLLQGSGVVLTRLGTWLLSLAGEGAYDPLPLQLVWGWALWCAAAWGAYQTWQRRQALVAMIPLGILLAIAVFFSGINISTLSIFLSLALALQVVSSWERKQHRWQTNQIDWATDLSHDIAFAAGLLIALIVVLSATLPQISISKIVNNLSTKFQECFSQSSQQVDSMAASFGLERLVPYPTRERPAGIPSGLPRRHLLGAGPELTEQLVMLIKTSDPLPTPPLPYEIVYNIDYEPPPAYYWLAATFDIYNGRGWNSGQTAVIELEANEFQLKPEGPGRVLTQTVQPVDSLGQVLFTTGFPLQVDRPSKITYRSNTDWAGTILENDETYVAQSWLLEPTEAELKAAGTDYPGWLTRRYLALPNKLPGRVRSLALELTATASTPYDRAIAIEEYLRAFPYSLDVPTPPHGQDVVDYFLFDLKKGYCDYYATSMVVLARAAGLPARLAIGYAPGPYDFNSFQYVIREAEAHSWAQVYFPGYGWIDFEPTGGRAPINRFAEDEPSPLPTLPANFNLEQALAAQQTWWETMPLWQVLAIGLAIPASVAIMSVLAVGVNNLRLGQLPADQLIPLLQNQLESGGRRLGLTLPEGTTPLEFQNALVQYLDYLAENRPRLQKIIPASADIAQLVGSFVSLRYAPRPVTAEVGVTCLAVWRRLRWRLWGTIVVKKVRRIR